MTNKQATVWSRPFQKGDKPEMIPAEFKLYRKKVSTLAARMDGPFEVKTTEGTLRCEDGWLAFDSRGYPYPIAADEFAQIYQEVPDIADGVKL